MKLVDVCYIFLLIGVVCQKLRMILFEEMCWGQLWCWFKRVRKTTI